MSTLRPTTTEQATARRNQRKMLTGRLSEAWNMTHQTTGFK